MKKILISLSILLLVSCGKEESNKIVEKKEYNLTEYQMIGHSKNGFRKTLVKNRIGLIDESGKKILPNEYENIFILPERIITLKNKNYGMTDYQGKQILENQYHRMDSLKDEMYLIGIDNKYGIVDRDGKVIVSPMYDFIGTFNENRAVVRMNNKYGYIDKEGKIIIPIEYKYATDFSQGFAIAVDETEKGAYIDKTGKNIVPFEYDNLYPISNGEGVVKKDKLYGVIDTEGNILIPIQHDYVNKIEKKLYSVEENGLFYLKDSKNVKISNGYDNIGEVKDGLIPVNVDSTYGYIDTKGEIIIPIKYSEIGENIKNSFIVKDLNSDKYGVIDIDDKFIISPIYDYILNRTEDYFVVGDIEGKEGIVGKNGKELVPLKYENIRFLNNNFAIGNIDSEVLVYIILKENEASIDKVNRKDIMDISSDEIVYKNGNKIEIIKIKKSDD